MHSSLGQSKPSKYSYEKRAFSDRLDLFIYMLWRLHIHEWHSHALFQTFRHCIANSVSWYRSTKKYNCHASLIRTSRVSKNKYPIERRTWRCLAPEPRSPLMFYRDMLWKYSYVHSKQIWWHAHDYSSATETENQSRPHHWPMSSFDWSLQEPISENY